MKKNSLKVLSVVIFFLGSLAFGNLYASSIDPPPGAYEGPLVAGQYKDYAGKIFVWNDSENLYVKFWTNADNVIPETHLAIVCNPSEIPTTKKGNPKIGHFPYYSEHEPPVHEYTHIIPLEYIGCSEIIIAAHCVIQCLHQDISETAWGGGLSSFPWTNLFPSSKRWALYIQYTIQ